MLSIMSIRPENWTETLFASRAQVRLLRVLARDPPKYWTEREAGSAANLSPSTSHLVFQRLHATGLLEARRVGRSHMVRLRPDVRLTARLHEIFTAEARTLDDVMVAAAREVPPNAAAFLFGSTARGEATPQSDLDFLVVAAESETAELTANRVREAVRRVLPAGIQVLALDRRRARQPRFRKLMRTVRREGRRLTKTTLEDVLR